jgi:predicted nucleic acid-binding Zn ribbon protein
MSEPIDFAVEFYFRMRNSAAGRISRDARRREDKAKNANSQPFEAGRNPKRAGSSITDMLKSFAWDTQLAEADLFNGWSEIVGTSNAEHSTPESLNRGLLTVRCESTAWATQLRLMQSQILERINETYPQLEIASLKFIGPDAPTWKKANFRFQEEGRETLTAKPK